MIAPSIANQIKRLLAEGKYSQRKIARMTGVSRGTVGAIAGGKRPDYEARARERQSEFESRIARPPVRPEERLRLDLSGDHRSRYERIRLRRTKEGPGRGGK